MVVRRGFFFPSRKDRTDLLAAEPKVDKHDRPLALLSEIAKAIESQNMLLIHYDDTSIGHATEIRGGKPHVMIGENEEKNIRWCGKIKVVEVDSGTGAAPPPRCLTTEQEIQAHDPRINLKAATFADAGNCKTAPDLCIGGTAARTNRGQYWQVSTREQDGDGRPLRLLARGEHQDETKIQLVKTANAESYNGNRLEIVQRKSQGQGDAQQTIWQETISPTSIIPTDKAVKDRYLAEVGGPAPGPGEVGPAADEAQPGHVATPAAAAGPAAPQAPQPAAGTMSAKKSMMSLFVLPHSYYSY